jgi:hypothetical protein
MKATMFLKYGMVDKEDIKAKLDQINKNQNKKLKPTMTWWKNYL